MIVIFSFFLLFFFGGGGGGGGGAGVAGLVRDPVLITMYETKRCQSFTNYFYFLRFIVMLTALGRVQSE